MMAGLFFVCACTYCHNPTEIEIKKLGRSIECTNCGHAFLAIDPDSHSAALDDPLSYWIRFTDHALTKEATELADKDIARTPR